MKKSIFVVLLAILLFSANSSVQVLSQKKQTISKESFEHNTDNKNNESVLFAFAPFDKQPVPIKISRPVYPSIALQSGLKGVVYVSVLIDETGKVKDAKVIKSSCIIFNNAALCAASKSTFEPAIYDGEKISFITVIPYSFKD